MFYVRHLVICQFFKNACVKILRTGQLKQPEIVDHLFINYKIQNVCIVKHIYLSLLGVSRVFPYFNGRSFQITITVPEKDISPITVR